MQSTDRLPPYQPYHSSSYLPVACPTIDSRDLDTADLNTALEEAPGIDLGELADTVLEHTDLGNFDPASIVLGEIVPAADESSLAVAVGEHTDHLKHIVPDGALLIAVVHCRKL